MSDEKKPNSQEKLECETEKARREGDPATNAEAPFHEEPDVEVLDPVGDEGFLNFKGTSYDGGKYLAGVQVVVNDVAGNIISGPTPGVQWTIYQGGVNCNADNTWQAISWWYPPTSTMPIPEPSSVNTFSTLACTYEETPIQPAPAGAFFPSRSVPAAQPVRVGDWLAYGLSADLNLEGILLMNGIRPLTGTWFETYITDIHWRIQDDPLYEMTRVQGNSIVAPISAPPVYWYSPWRLAGAPQGAVYLTQKATNGSALSRNEVLTSEDEHRPHSFGAISDSPLLYANLNTLPRHPQRPNTGGFTLWIKAEP